MVCSMGIIIFLLLVPAPEDLDIQNEAKIQLSDITDDKNTKNSLKPDSLMNKGSLH